jgi:hypothetical protein
VAPRRPCSRRPGRRRPAAPGPRRPGVAVPTCLSALAPSTALSQLRSTKARSVHGPHPLRVDRPVAPLNAAYRDGAGGLDVDALAPTAADELASAGSRLEGLAALRRDVNRGSIAPAAALDYFNTTIADLLNTNRGLVSGIAAPQLAQRVGVFVALSRIKELAAPSGSPGCWSATSPATAW